MHAGMRDLEYVENSNEKNQTRMLDYRADSAAPRAGDARRCRERRAVRSWGTVKDSDNESNMPSKFYTLVSI